MLSQVPEAVFLIIGPVDEEKADAFRGEEDNNLDDNMIFTGLRQDIPELMSIMKIFVLPSHREGFPVVTMEASAMGLPSS